MQGWPDFFARGPNLQEKYFLGAAKNLSKIFCAWFFFNFKPKMGQIIVFSSKIMPKTGKYFLKVCYRGRKKTSEGRLRPAGRSLAMPI
jgi:hypothetical protein